LMIRRFDSIDGPDGAAYLTQVITDLPDQAARNAFAVLALPAQERKARPAHVTGEMRFGTPVKGMIDHFVGEELIDLHARYLRRRTSGIRKQSPTAGSTDLGGLFRLGSRSCQAMARVRGRGPLERPKVANGRV